MKITLAAGVGNSIYHLTWVIDMFGEISDQK